MQGSESRESSVRRQRVACRICSRPIELARMREHLRSEHQVDSSQLEGMYLESRIQARRARRSRP
ncbi:MAG: hypothetical protein ABSB97_06550 [Thermoplasmata archaeon]